MRLATPRGASRLSILIAVVATLAVGGYFYVRWESRCCAPAPIVIPPGGKDHLPPIDGVMPSDFALRVASSNGSVAPPYHYEFDIAVDSAGHGTLHYWPGYGHYSSRMVTGQFTVDWTTRQRWWFVARGLVSAPGSRPQSQIPVGGASSAIEIRALSTDKAVEPWQPAPWSALSDSLTAMMRAAVPDSLWQLTEAAQRQLQ